jgi:hypothetical protein
MTSIPVICTPVTLADGYCPNSYQQFNLDIMKAQWRVDLANTSYFVLSPTPPNATQYSDAIWIKTEDGVPVRAYTYVNGLWLSRHPITAGSKRLHPFEGSVDEIALEDGGSPGTATVNSGPFWELASDWNGRMPIGVNDALVGGPDLTLPQYSLGFRNTGTQADPLGMIRLTDYRKLPQHTHGLGWGDGAQAYGADLSLPAIESQASTLAELYELTAPVSAGVWEASSNSLERTGQATGFTQFTQLNTFSWDAAAPRNTARTVENFENRVPIVAVHWMRRTIRQYYAEA